MIRLLGILMVVGVCVGCGEEIEVVKKTQHLTEKLIEEYEVYRDEKSNKPVKHGYYKSYYEDELYKEEGNYVDDTRNSKWVVYDEDSGKIREEGNYVDDTRNGKWVVYDEEGNIVYEYCYDIGKRVDCPEDD